MTAVARDIAGVVTAMEADGDVNRVGEQRAQAELQAVPDTPVEHSVRLLPAGASRVSGRIGAGIQARSRDASSFRCREPDQRKSLWRRDQADQRQRCRAP